MGRIDQRRTPSSTCSLCPPCGSRRPSCHRRGPMAPCIGVPLRRSTTISIVRPSLPSRGTRAPTLYVARPAVDGTVRCQDQRFGCLQRNKTETGWKRKRKGGQADRERGSLCSTKSKSKSKAEGQREERCFSPKTRHRMKQSDSPCRDGIVAEHGTTTEADLNTPAPGSSIRVPGARASTFSGRKLFNSFLRYVISSRSGFGLFARTSIGLTTRQDDVCTELVTFGFPIPLPYPEALRKSWKANPREISRKKMMNTVVIALNYLHLDRPPRCPSHLLPGRRLSAHHPEAAKIVNLHFPLIYIFARIYIPNLRKLKGKCKFYIFPKNVFFRRKIEDLCKNENFHFFLHTKNYYFVSISLVSSLDF